MRAIRLTDTLSGLYFLGKLGLKFLTLLAITVLVLGLAIQASSQVLPSDVPTAPLLTSDIDLTNRHSVEVAMLDNPSQHLPWLRQELQRIDPKREPVAWVRACWAIALEPSLEVPIEEEMAEDSSYRQKLPTCIENAKKLDLYLEWANLRSFQESMQRKPDDFQYYEVQMNQLIQEVRKVNNADALAFVLVEYAFEMLQRKILDKSLPFIIEAFELLEKHQTQSLLVYFQTRSALCMSLDYRGQSDEAVRVNSITYQQFKQQGLRHAAAEISYNSGYSLLFNSKPDNDAAKAHLLEAIRLTETLPERGIRGSSLMYLSLISSRRSQFTEAIDQARQAIQIFTEEKDPLWTSRSQLRLGEALIDAKSYSGALIALDSAWTGFADQALEYKNSVQWARYRAYSGLQNAGLALRYLEFFNQGFQEYAKIHEAEQYHKAGATLGLQLEKEKSRLLEKEKQQLMGLVIFAAFAIIVMVYGLLQAREVRRQKLGMQAILEGVEEGIVKFGKDCLIEPNYSRHLLALLGEEQDLQGRPLLDLLYLGTDVSGDEKQVVASTLQSILGEIETAWDLNSSHLPSELHRQGKSMLLLWTPLFGNSGIIDKIMLVLRDVTKSRDLERELHRQKSQVETLAIKMAEIIQMPRKRLPIFAASLRKYHELIARDLNDQDSPELLRRLHTFKGEARSLGFAHLSQVIHEVETSLLQHSLPLLQVHALTELRDLCASYLTLLEHMHQPMTEAKSNLSLVEVAGSALGNFRNHLRKYEISFGGITIDDQVDHWDSSHLEWVQAFILHGLTNAIDHGFVLPKSLGIQLDRPAQFLIRAWTTKAQLHLEIRDNGRGIDWNFVKLLAAKKNFIPAPQRPLSDVLFLDGESSSLAITETSGRGVGLAAIRSLCVNAGGSVQLLDNEEGNGARLVAEIPLAAEPLAKAV